MFPLNLVDKALHAGKEGIRMGKQYITGARDLYHNGKKVQLILQDQQKTNRELTRREFLFVKNTEADMQKLMPFFVVAFFIPESLPFLMMWMPSFFPSTCISQQDREKSYVALAKTRKELSEAMVKELESKSTIPVSTFLSNKEVVKIASFQPQYFFVDNIEKPFLTKLNKLLGLPYRGPAFFQRNRFKDHLSIIREDDLRLVGDGLNELTLEELKVAAESRGMMSAISPSSSSNVAGHGEAAASESVEGRKNEYSTALADNVGLEEVTRESIPATHDEVTPLYPLKADAISPKQGSRNRSRRGQSRNRARENDVPSANTTPPVAPSLGPPVVRIISPDAQALSPAAEPVEAGNPFTPQFLISSGEELNSTAHASNTLNESEQDSGQAPPSVPAVTADVRQISHPQPPTTEPSAHHQGANSLNPTNPTNPANATSSSRRSVSLKNAAKSAIKFLTPLWALIWVFNPIWTVIGAIWLSRATSTFSEQARVQTSTTSIGSAIMVPCWMASPVTFYLTFFEVLSQIALLVSWSVLGWLHVRTTAMEGTYGNGTGIRFDDARFMVDDPSLLGNEDFWAPVDPESMRPAGTGISDEEWDALAAEKFLRRNDCIGGWEVEEEKDHEDYRSWDSNADDMVELKSIPESTKKAVADDELMDIVIENSVIPSPQKMELTRPQFLVSTDEGSVIITGLFLFLRQRLYPSKDPTITVPSITREREGNYRGSFRANGIEGLRPNSQLQGWTTSERRRRQRQEEWGSDEEDDEAKTESDLEARRMKKGKGVDTEEHTEVVIVDTEHPDAIAIVVSDQSTSTLASRSSRLERESNDEHTRSRVDSNDDHTRSRVDSVDTVPLPKIRPGTLASTTTSSTLVHAPREPLPTEQE
ncbi:hypothetical protein HDU97_009252 [Phlyctochytrium planicorne]|nr:hypothetical protein HDU97_009252 [Phlyctochytrium planicorne]